MTLPPGRARLATRPAPTGSPAFVITMGMVVVALFAANAGGVPVTTIRSTLRRTKSAASSGRRSAFASANRYSMVIFFPSIHPSLLSSCRNAPRGPRYRKQCFYPGNLCGRFSLPAAPRQEQQSAKSKAPHSKSKDIFFIHFPLSSSVASHLSNRSSREFMLYRHLVSLSPPIEKRPRRTAQRAPQTKN